MRSDWIKVWQQLDMRKECKCPPVDVDCSLLVATVYTTGESVWTDAEGKSLCFLSWKIKNRHTGDTCSSEMFRGRRKRREKSSFASCYYLFGKPSLSTLTTFLIGFPTQRGRTRGSGGADYPHRQAFWLGQSYRLVIDLFNEQDSCLTNQPIYLMREVVLNTRWYCWISSSTLH